jgi:2',3'-cyclic-nucleotide 2'-phosphodiesterase (5'-nucleotidase family)
MLKLEVRRTRFAKPDVFRPWFLCLLALMAIPAAQSIALAQHSDRIESCRSVSAPVSNASPASSQPALHISTRTSKTMIDANIPPDPVINRMLEPYSAKVRALDTVIGKLRGELNKGGMGAGTLGNFVSDGIRTYASRRLARPVILVLTNSGGLRRNTIAECELRARDIFELLPFEDALVEIDLTGAQLLRLLGVVVANRDAQSGARIRYRTRVENRPKLVGAELIDFDGLGSEIDPKATYTIVTIDYLLRLASSSYAILRKSTNIKPLGVTIRDAIMEYVKAETAAGRPVQAELDGRFVLEGLTKDKPDKLK